MADTTFQITCTMKDRWIPYFLGMLKEMQRLGAVGSSRSVTFFSDGDGDFRPKFEAPSNLPVEPPTKTLPSGDTLFDAG